MKMLTWREVLIAILAIASVNSVLAADAFPSKPIRIIVSSAPGGTLDVTTRYVAEKMSRTLGQQVVVENRVGAGGLIAIRAVKAAPADGYTLLATVNTVAIQQAIKNNPGYDLVRDFVGVAPFTRSPYVVLISPNQPDKGLSELIARAKAKPGELTYASAGNGTTTQLATALFAQRAGLNLQHIAYKGNPAAWPDVMSGRVTMIFEPYASTSSMIRGGQLKPLGVTSTGRLPALPDVPTLAEQGVANASIYVWVGMLAPSGTPKDVVAKLSEAVRSGLDDAETARRTRDEGAEVMSMSPEEFTRFLGEEVRRYTKLVAEIGMVKED